MAIFKQLSTTLAFSALALSAAIYPREDDTISTKPACVKADALVPSFQKSIDTILFDADYKNASIERLSGAVQIPTLMDDDPPNPEEDPDYYSEFITLHNYLNETFPLIHKNLKLEFINTFGLLYTWTGSDASLKPMLFTAHQDVVPVNNDTIDDWSFPSFSGHYDNKTDSLYGRGSFDVKNLMIAHMEAVEKLLEDGYQTDRTVLLAYGFDEEAGGSWGAKYIANHLEKEYGQGGIMVMFDEGPGLVKLGNNTYVAAIPNAEKGYLDAEVTINGVGGHSSSPPAHTTIGVAASMITSLEDNPPFFSFNIENPLYGFITCAAEYSTLLPMSMKKVVLGASTNKTLENLLGLTLFTTELTKNYVTTTQAVDLIDGGLKANALPETTEFTTNYRIAYGSSVANTKKRFLKYANLTAASFGYGLIVDNKQIINTTSLGYINVSYVASLEPSPVSPSSGPTWDLLTGTIQNLFVNDLWGPQNLDNNVYSASAIVTTNTDSRHYWNVTDTIYRFIGAVTSPTILETIHSADEHVIMDNHLQSVAFFYEFIVNTNEHGQEIK
ncbi:similar to Saccharomyces cerevisiae YJL172W CPS1 Vacuolar carboxypeptidase yscS [Maudiozyma saulgeensis]|uniref:Similar to Saccharomyces cerevisiae YJL172W CPS1 Vacuolar carboxypeptidase yscS n=1 Tax=Maudiozyma saulgeensis TaxID=1789683 RepID=A0A1X7QWV9_9SACH|nr:similar to Saccharomyces cerevisiae YJL172W CPS1 Vacuolar carboxypeptidase yscS [Kazachstania saulgeensis]